MPAVRRERERRGRGAAGRGRAAADGRAVRAQEPDEREVAARGRERERGRARVVGRVDRVAAPREEQQELAQLGVARGGGLGERRARARPRAG